MRMRGPRESRRIVPKAAWHGKTGPATQCVLLRLPRTPHVENAVRSPTEMDEGPRWPSPYGPCRRFGREVPAASGGGMVALQGEIRVWPVSMYPDIREATATHIDRFTFGSIRIDGVTYEHDVVITGGRVGKRKKKASKPFRGAFGHTPVSIEENIPWDCRCLVVGTGADGALPVMDEVKQEASRRDVDLLTIPTREHPGPAGRAEAHERDLARDVLIRGSAGLLGRRPDSSCELPTSRLEAVRGSPLQGSAIAGPAASQSAFLRRRYSDVARPIQAHSAGVHQRTGNGAGRTPRSEADRRSAGCEQRWWEPQLARRSRSRQVQHRVHARAWQSCSRLTDVPALPLGQGMTATPIILVPGFWLGAWAWDHVVGALRADGHAVTALTLPGLDSADVTGSPSGSPPWSTSTPRRGKGPWTPASRESRSRSIGSRSRKRRTSTA